MVCVYVMLQRRPLQQNDNRILAGQFWYCSGYFIIPTQSHERCAVIHVDFEVRNCILHVYCLNKIIFCAGMMSRELQRLQIWLIFLSPILIHLRHRTKLWVCVLPCPLIQKQRTESERVICGFFPCACYMCLLIHYGHGCKNCISTLLKVLLNIFVILGP